MRATKPRGKPGIEAKDPFEVMDSNASSQVWAEAHPDSRRRNRSDFSMIFVLSGW